MTKSILFIGFYEMREYLLSVKESFLNLGYNMSNYPLFQYAYDVNDKKEDYKNHLKNYIEEVRPDIILWWFLDIPYEVIKYVRDSCPNIYYIMYNSNIVNKINSDILKKAEIFNLVVTSCKEFVKKYTIATGVKAIWLPPGYNPEIFFPIKDNLDNNLKFNCDISIVLSDSITNIDYPDQYIDRHSLIVNVIEFCKKNNKVFKIFGSAIFKEIYPENYVDDLTYNEYNLLFNYSKINIVTHYNQHHDLCVLPCEIKIIASGGLLFVDNCLGQREFYSSNKNVVFMDKKNYINQISDILENYSTYLRIRKNPSIKWTWQTFATKIHKKIMKQYFDPISYKKIYQNNIPNDNLWKYWKIEGIKYNHICYPLSVPDNFNYVSYADDNDISGDIETIYYHWYINSKSLDYIRDTTQATAIIDSASLNVNMETIFEIFTILTNIKEFKENKKFNDDNLEKLALYSNKFENININKCIENYFDMCD